MSAAIAPEAHYGNWNPRQKPLRLSVLARNILQNKLLTSILLYNTVVLEW